MGDSLEVTQTQHNVTPHYLGHSARTPRYLVGPTIDAYTGFFTLFEHHLSWGGIGFATHSTCVTSALILADGMFVGLSIRNMNNLRQTF